MELNSETGIGLIEPNVVEVSPEHLRSLLTLIETELHHSQVYQIALANLQKILGDAAPKGEILLNAVGREGIQLALKQLLIRQSQTIVQTVAKDNYSNSVAHSSSSPTEQAALQSWESAALLSQQSDLSSSLQEVSVISSGGEAVSNGVHSYSVASEFDQTSSEETLDSHSAKDEASVQKQNKRKKRLTEAELAAQAAEKREACLRQVGQELRQAREALSVSLTQLHRQTLVPLSHLRALETGQIEELPEDVYLRGFICRLGNALGLNGTAMAASIPTPDPLQHLMPTWSKAELDSNFYLNSVHLYLGYAAILAGSLGGIAWLSQQSIPETTIPPEMQKLLQENEPQSRHRQHHSESKASSKPGLASAEMGVVLGADIAPPQAMDTDLMPQEMTSMGFGSYQPEG
ncbi:helix-turn-helix domain-containing protein [Limnoraphis robusta]|uniref:Helix-turn-helix domain-containing protein n=1 Tax=Limnoraphis robusta CCNP1315 TaxID=3110306 RepID=A0ABU5TVW0_9CYAN|nr:helix-turn-helix domain-containing protein [Limnoraphis robusta]MEA5519038.1 helix-turn-helix domain-containing protein [Limnoraphis robusta CCNP1315]MEA5544112.1 helix-turn-helix domain-containing protein [Limnoraphis robusta CCNP1324]